MFMVKGECANIVNLLRVKMKISSRNFFSLPIIALIGLCATLTVPVVSIVRSGGEGQSSYLISDYSTSFFFGVIVAYIMMMFLYRGINGNLSVFPQTNTARFITSEAINCIIAIYVGLIALAMYLIYNAAIKILSLFYESVHFALNFDIGFIVAGFITFLLYSLIIAAVIDLIGAILRKWTTYAAVAFIALIALAVVNIMTVVEYAPEVLAFLVKEASFGLFVIKALALWFAIAAVSLVINRYTVYHKKQGIQNKRLVVVLSVIIAAVITIGIPLILFDNAGSGGSGLNTAVNETAAESIDNYFRPADVIRIDISHLRRGSNINLVVNDNIVVISNGGSLFYGHGNFAAYLSGTDALGYIQGNTIAILFRPPFRHVNGFELASFINPRLGAYLEGDTLHIDYSIDDAHIVYIPIWSIAGQFDIFKDKGIVTENPLGHSTGGNSYANILISVG